MINAPTLSTLLFRHDFIEFCKNSSSVRHMIELESKGNRSRSGSLQGNGSLTPGAVRRLAKIDKAAVAFKVGAGVHTIYISTYSKWYTRSEYNMGNIV